MIKRKIITALLAAPISLFFIFAVFFGEWERPVELIVMSMTFSLWISPFIFLYGVPVSFLSDYASKRLEGRSRTLVAFFVHLVFAALFGFIFPMNSPVSLFGGEVDWAVIFASIVALFFWIFDELLRKKKMNPLRICKCCYSFSK